MIKSTESEMKLRQTLGVIDVPNLSPDERFLQLGAFWQHWTLHKRKCDLTEQQIISVYSDDCPYPVWHKDEWVKNADPAGADFAPDQPVFAQMWDFFKKSPIPHIVGTGNENCEYTDDCWYSKNCYLTHSLVESQDLRYCYRIIRSKDSMYSVFCADIELGMDLINCTKCFNLQYSAYSHQCRDSAFLFDCRNCADSMFCWNLRNKQYCYFNEQLTKEEFEKKREEWDLMSREVYQRGIAEFYNILLEKAWIKSLQIINCENSTGDHLESCKNCENCYFQTFEVEDCINCIRGYKIKNCLDNVSTMDSELVYYSSCAQDKCYDVKFGYNLVQCRFAEYSAYCFQCKNIFGCCGLVGKEYYIFNKPYTPEEYAKKKQEIIDEMKKSGEYGNFFPGYFAANPYEESLSGFYFPLDDEELEKWGFRSSSKTGNSDASYLSVDNIPDTANDAEESIYGKVFWDAKSKRPFQILKEDIQLSKKLKVPLPWSYYTQRTQDNFKLIPFFGSTRTISCAQCKKEVQTSWSEKYSKRIICEECYLEYAIK